jgi:hypothetical protein
MIQNRRDRSMTNSASEWTAWRQHYEDCDRCTADRPCPIGAELEGAPRRDDARHHRDVRSTE